MGCPCIRIELGDRQTAHRAANQPSCGTVRNSAGYKLSETSLISKRANLKPRYIISLFSKRMKLKLR